MLDEYWRTSLREVEATAQDLPQLILDCSRLVLEIKEGMKQKHTQWLHRPLDLDRYSSKDSMIDFGAPNTTPESGISLGHKRKRDQLEKGCDHEQDGRVSCTLGNIPLAHDYDHSPHAYGQDEKSKQQPADELVRGFSAYHGSISSEFQESMEMQGSKAKTNRLEYLERSLSKNISVLADCSSILELFLPQVLTRRLEASSSTTITTSSFTTTVGYVLTLWVSRVFARPRTKGQSRSRAPPMDLSRVQST